MTSTDNPTVLLVEDSQTQRLSIQVLLEKAEYQVVTAENGREAIEKIREREPAIVLTDLHMPEVNGLELVKRINAEWPSLPVILITGEGSEEVAVEALKSGAASYVSKADSVRGLLDTIERVIVVSRPGHSFGYLLASLESCRYSFLLTNDRALVFSLVQYIQRLAERICFREATQLRNFGIAIEEALLNALYHGNLELPGEIKDFDVEETTAFIEQRKQETPFEQRKIHVTVEVSPQDVEVVVRDEGVGFQYQERFKELLVNDNSSVVMTEGLRGLLLIHMFMDRVEFNKRGNEIRMVKQADESPENKGTSELESIEF